MSAVLSILLGLVLLAPAGYFDARAAVDVTAWLADSYLAFYDWFSEGVSSFLVTINPIGTASATSYYAVLNDVACDLDAWSDTGCWALTSGGAGVNGPPGSTDDAFFDGNSGSSAMALTSATSVRNVDLTGYGGTISGGSQTWSIYGDVTNLQGKYTYGTSTVQFAGTSTQTISPASVTLTQFYLVELTGAGEKRITARVVINLRLTATTSVQVSVSSAANTGLILTAGGQLISATSGNILTFRSQTPTSAWTLDNTGITTTFYRVDIQDATAAITAYATDVTNTDSGRNTRIVFTPRSSMIEDTVGYWTASSVDYASQIVRNKAGELVAVYSDGTGVNNGRIMARYSTDDGQTWSSRVIIYSPTAAGDGIVDSVAGGGWELYVVLDGNDVMYVTGHKLLVGGTHIYFTKVNIASAANVAIWSNWLSASGSPAPSSGAAVDGQGYDDLGGGADPSVAFNLKGDILVAYNKNSGADGPAVVRMFTNGGWSSQATLDYNGGANEAVVIAVTDAYDDWHLLAKHVEDGTNDAIVYKTCLSTEDCTVAANWMGADGVAKYDVVITSTGVDFGFPHVTVDANNIVHVTAGTNTLIAGFSRIFHNYRPRGESWALGVGQEINGNQAIPLRTRVADGNRFGLTADSAGNVFLIYAEKNLGYIGYHQWSEVTRSWGAHTALMYAGSTQVSTLHSASGSATVEYLVANAVGSTTIMPGLVYQAVTGSADIAWWSASPSTPGGGGGPGEGEGGLLWTWRHLDRDLTVRFSVVAPQSAASYSWYSESRLLGTGSVLDVQFLYSGTYDVVLKSGSIEKTGQVEAKSVSFLGAHLPLLLLVVVGVWYMILVFSGMLKSDSGKLAGLAVSVFSFMAAFLVMQGISYRTVSLESGHAILLYMATALFCIGGSVRGSARILFVVGLGLLAYGVFGLLNV